MPNLVVNQKAVDYLKGMIQQGNVDKEGAWGDNEPTTESENAFLADHTHAEYGNWFLAENTDANADTKERYEFPVGNFKMVFRSGLIAAEQRAGQYKHEEIKAAARMLLDMVG